MQKGMNKAISSSGLTRTGPAPQKRDKPMTDEQREIVARTLRNGTKSGIFVDDPVRKPMPLSTKRFVPFPRLSFRVPRRTASGCSDLSQGSLHSTRSNRTSGSTAKAWVCDQCSYSNEDEENQTCALCGHLHAEFRNSTTELHNVTDDDESSGSDSSSSSGEISSDDESACLPTTPPNHRPSLPPPQTNSSFNQSMTSASTTTTPISAHSSYPAQPLSQTTPLSATSNHSYKASVQETRPAIVPINPFEMHFAASLTQNSQLITDNPFDAWEAVPVLERPVPQRQMSPIMKVHTTAPSLQYQQQKISPLGGPYSPTSALSFDGSHAATTPMTRRSSESGATTCHHHQTAVSSSPKNNTPFNNNNNYSAPPPAVKRFFSFGRRASIE